MTLSKHQLNVHCQSVCVRGGASEGQTNVSDYRVHRLGGAGASLDLAWVLES